MSRVAAIGYVPPPSFGCAQQFYDNLQANPADGELLLFSDHAWPGVLQIKASPEMVKGALYPPDQRNPEAGHPNPFAVNNLLWLTSLRIARDRGYSHILYLESDCRVGKAGWDTAIFDEFFGLGRPLIAGGSLGVYNPCNWSQEAARRWAQLVSTNVRRNVPIPTYGYLSAAVRAPSCVFPNGALAVYDVNWMAALWNLDNTGETAVSNSAFDMVLGQLIWKRFEEDSYEVVGHLNSIFSSYGDVLTSEDERMAWLREGRYVAIHQCKSTATL